MWGPVVASLHQSSQHLYSPPPLCPLTDKIAVPHQNGTRSRYKFPIYYLFTCTSRLYDKQHFIRPHALQLLPWTASPLQMGLIGCPKMLVWNYHFTLHYIPEQHRYQNYCPYILHRTLYSTLTWKQGYIYIFLNSSSEVLVLYINFPSNYILWKGLILHTVLSDIWVHTVLKCLTEWLS